MRDRKSLFGRMQTALLVLLVITIPGLPFALMMERITNGGVSHAARVTAYQLERLSRDTGLTALMQDAWIAYHDRGPEPDKPVDDTWHTKAIQQAADELGQAAGQSPSDDKQHLLTD
ncbi:MAG: hypothetical protein Alpg2KO_29070 [Alphaproteobacteria bacterium]